MADQIRVLLGTLDPISWKVSRAAWVLIAVALGFVVLEGLRIGTWPSAVAMWLTLAAILTIVCRIQRIRYREVATLLIPAVLLLAVLPFAADATLQLVTTFFVFFGVIAIPIFPSTLVAWIGFVAPAHYRAIAESDDIVSDTFERADDAVNAQLVASEGDLAKIRDAVANARESVRVLASLEKDWENVRVLFLSYLDWYDEVTDPTSEDWAACRARRKSAVEARTAVVKDHSQWVGHRLLVHPGRPTSS